MVHLRIPEKAVWRSFQPLLQVTTVSRILFFDEAGMMSMEIKSSTIVLNSRVD
jgi:hypothetical protein